MSPYCAPSCTTTLLSLGLLSICCQPSSTIRNRGGVPPSFKLQVFHNVNTVIRKRECELNIEKIVSSFYNIILITSSDPPQHPQL